MFRDRVLETVAFLGLPELCLAGSVFFIRDTRGAGTKIALVVVSCSSLVCMTRGCPTAHSVIGSFLVLLGRRIASMMSHLEDHSYPTNPTCKVLWRLNQTISVSPADHKCAFDNHAKCLVPFFLAFSTLQGCNAVA